MGPKPQQKLFVKTSSPHEACTKAGRKASERPQLWANAEVATCCALPAWKVAVSLLHPEGDLYYDLCGTINPGRKISNQQQESA